MTRTRSLLLLSGALLLASAAAPSGCAVEGTGGELVPIEIAFVGATETDALGVSETVYEPAWQLELEEAYLSIGAVYAFPPAELARRPAVDPRLGRLLPFVPQARAHAGDDNEFALNAVAESLEPIVLDGLDPTPQVVEVLAEAGPAAEMTVWFEHPRVEDGPTRGFQGWVRGVARQGDREVRFEAGIDLRDTVLGKRVDNVPIEGDAELAAGSRLTLALHAEQWLRQVDFDALLADGSLAPESDGYARPGLTFRPSWLINFHDPDAFRARLATPHGRE